MKIKYLAIAFSMITINVSCKEKAEDIPKKEEIVENKYDLVVAQDGTGNYKTVQEAVNAVPNNKTKDFVIYIKNGTYKEVVNIPSSKTFIMFLGESVDKTIITYDNYAKKLNSEGKEYGTSGSSSVFVNGNNFKAENVTFENTSGIDAGQAVAINIGAAKSAFKNCRFLGFQDTFYAGNGTLQYVVNSYIAGTVDFIFGGSTAFFENCTLHSFRDGYLTAASTPQEQKYGYVFENCKIVGASTLKKASVYLGRPWRPYANVVFIGCEMGGHIRPEGWHNWGNTENEKTARYGEFESTGEGYQAGKRVVWSKQLTVEESKTYTKQSVLGSWNPFN